MGVTNKTDEQSSIKGRPKLRNISLVLTGQALFLNVARKGKTCEKDKTNERQ